MQRSTIFVGVSFFHCTSWDSINAGYQLWFAGSALADTLIAFSMITMVILNSCEQEKPMFKF